MTDIIITEQDMRAGFEHMLRYVQSTISGDTTRYPADYGPMGGQYRNLSVELAWRQWQIAVKWTRKAYDD